MWWHFVGEAGSPGLPWPHLDSKMGSVAFLGWFHEPLRTLPMNELVSVAHHWDCAQEALPTEAGHDLTLSFASWWSPSSLTLSEPRQKASPKPAGLCHLVLFWLFPPVVILGSSINCFYPQSTKIHRPRNTCGIVVSLKPSEKHHIFLSVMWPLTKESFCFPIEVCRMSHCLLSLAMWILLTVAAKS